MEKRTKTIVLTGGHAATTALATLIELEKDTETNWNIHFIGSKKAIEGKKESTLESRIFSQKEVKFHNLFTGRLQRRFTFWTIPSILKIPFGFVHATFLLRKIKPQIILSFGGFAAFPVVVAGWILKIPIVIHEQTIAVGRTNKYSSFFATKIALAREESKKYFPNNKCIVVGNPILPKFFEIANKAHNVPLTIFVTGGSRGSIHINNYINSLLERLLREFKIVHQSGSLEKEKFFKRKENLPKDLAKNYTVYPDLEPEEMVDMYSRADIIISRAGANSVSEIIAAKRPAILIPIPWSYEDEQNKNAIYAQNWGIAKMINQETTTYNELWEVIINIKNNLQDITKRVEDKISPDKEASAKLSNLIKEICR